MALAAVLFAGIPLAAIASSGAYASRRGYTRWARGRGGAFQIAFVFQLCSGLMSGFVWRAITMFDVDPVYDLFTAFLAVNTTVSLFALPAWLALEHGAPQSTLTIRA